MRHLLVPCRCLLVLLALAAGGLMPGRALAQAGAGMPLPLPPPAEPPREAETPPATDAPREVREGELVDIRVEGNRRVEREAIRRALKQQPGELFDPESSDEDLRAVWALGYFSDVQLLVQRLPSGGLVYVVRVEERPTVREVTLTGNEELSQDDLKEAIEVKPFTLLDMDVVRRTAKKIQEKYVDKGYFLAEVNWRIDKLEGRQTVNVVFLIDEHAKVMVKEILLLGAKQVTAEQLKAVMLTKEGGFLSFLTGEGTYREEVFQRDLAAINAAYYDEGFINVRVDKPTVSLSADKRFIYITLRITEGEPFTVGKLDFSGDLVVPREEMAQRIVSKEGQRFNRSRLVQDIQALSDVYYDQGYAYANINPVTSVDAEGRTVGLTFDVQKGPQVSVERIDIVGNTKTRDKVIRRELRVYEGELFSGTGVRRSKDRVTALGFFETVEVTQRPGSRPDTIALQVEVKEKATGTFQVGLGFSNVENFIFTAQIQQNNFLGWGQNLSASAQISSLRSLIQLSFFDPYFLDTNFILSTDFFRVEADFGDFVRSSTGGSLSLGYQLIEDLMVTGGYTQEHVNVQAARDFGGVLLANRFLSGVTSAVRLSATYDKRNNRLFPSQGFMHFGSVEYAPNWLGGTFLFSRYSAYSRYYLPLPLGAVFKTNVTLGYIQQLDPQRPLPISELYYLGGINTLRGYFLRSISPTLRVPRSDSPEALIQELAVGGNKQLILNAELEFPIFEKAGVRGVVFYDAGNAFAFNERFFEDKQDRVPLGLFHTVGFGFRWFSPVGPLRFEWGIPLTRRPQDQPILFEFNIGNFF